MNSNAQKEFLEATAWLRPFTRWAAGFSVKTQGYLPAMIRNMPLKLVKSVLVRRLNRVNAGCKSR